MAFTFKVTVKLIKLAKMKPLEVDRGCGRGMGNFT